MLIQLADLGETPEFDVLIVGAGMVGASTAVGLRQLGLRVLLVDAFGFTSAVPNYTPSYDARSTALSWGTRGILEQLSVWSEVAELAWPISEVHVSEKNRLATTRINAADYDQAAVGYVVPNQWLGRCLLSRVDDLDIPLLCSAHIDSIKSVHRKQEIKIVQDSEGSLNSLVLKARLLIISDGADSATARKLGIGVSTDNYGQQAIIANVSTELPNMDQAFERFIPGGPLAMLPIGEHESAMVWTHSLSESERFMAMPESEFCREIELAFGERLGRILKCGKRTAYPLKLVQAQEQCRQGVLLLGNAAHSLHPVAGQGFNLAIRGVAACVEYIANSISKQYEFESLAGLRKLCSQRFQDQQKTIALSDQLVKLFGNSSKVLGVLRELGLLGLDRASIPKRLFAEQTMGIAGRKNSLQHVVSK